MNIAGGIKFALNSRGLENGFCRLNKIKKRFGITPEKLLKAIEHYLEILKPCGIKPTFFITACILDRYINGIKRIGFDCAEWGIHGFVHTDHSRMALREQKKQIEKAIQVFDKHRVPFKGFRPPYLRTNGDTVKAVHDAGRFTYLSSKTILWDEIYGPELKSLRWSNNFYQPLPLASAFPYLAASGLVEIPVSLPDDDSLMDRDNLDPESVQELWLRMLRLTQQKNGVFILQLHPERIFELDGVLIRLIKEAKSLNPPLYISSLGELAQVHSDQRPGTRGIFCITGDIDAMAIGDFALRLKEW